MKFVIHLIQIVAEKNFILKKAELIAVIFLLIALPLRIFADNPHLTDTVKIKEVIISVNRQPGLNPGFKLTSITKSEINDLGRMTIAEVLAERTGIFIKSYGLGGNASPSFRGTGASHTIIAWNGVSLNSPMLGQVDLSIIPSVIADDIHIYYGSASMFNSQGGLGGLIDIETKPAWQKNTDLSLTGGMGSFGRYTAVASVRTGNMNFQSTSKAYFISAENNFRFLDDQSGATSLWRTRTNNQLAIRGLMQEFYLRKGESSGEAHIWYQSADRNLPSPILSEQPGLIEKQFDESLRSIITYNHEGNNGKLTVNSSWVMTRINYFNNIAAIDSKNLSNSLMLKTSYELQAGENTIINGSAEFLSDNVRTNNYDSDKSRNIITLKAFAERSSGKFGFTFLTSEQVVKGHFNSPDFSAGANYDIGKYGRYNVKASVSKNSKIPTLNDMYWSPGGNPDLKNEQSLTGEIGLSGSTLPGRVIDIKTEVTAFHSLISNLITWHPGQYSFWTADNLKDVVTTGVEASLKLNWKTGNLSSEMSASYTFTHASYNNNSSSGSEYKKAQLMYVPENQANIFYKANYRVFYSLLSANFTDRRFITTDDSKYLEPYIVFNINAGVRLQVKNSIADLALGISNLFGARYQTIAYYPMPGRSYDIKLIFNIKK